MKHLSIIFVFVFVLTFSISFAQTNWTKHGSPVLDPGPAGEWDDQRLGICSVLFDGSTYHMWYTADSVGGNLHDIGYATSADGIIWTKYDDSNTPNPPFAESDPVLSPGTPGSWDDDRVNMPCVILIDTVYHMWYTGADNPDPNEGAIGHATSTNGITWEKNENNPVLDVGPPGSWEDEWVWDPWVLFDGSMYHMWYYAWNGIGEQNRIGHATSPHPDGTWTKDPNNPVLSFENGKWDYPRALAPCVIYDGNTFHMWYSGGQMLGYRIGYVTSEDGSQWTKFEDNPVLEVGSAGSWDDTMVGFCSVIDSAGSRYKMWYTGVNSVGVGCVGYATAPHNPPVGIEDDLYHNSPGDFTLSQNYPNPFNPVTMINYQLPMTSKVELSIYNLLGQKVVTLVNQRQLAGSYQVQWDASGFSSGIYIYSLETATGLKQSRKLILLK
jgi:predicted GH43/DUF377 family glycosyl hydrolase